MASHQVMSNRKVAISALAKEWKALGCVELDKEASDEWLREICVKYDVSMRLAREYLFVSKQKAKAEIIADKKALSYEESQVLNNNE